MKTNNDILSILRQIPEIAALSDDRLGVLAGFASLESLGENDILYREDEKNLDLFYLISGVLESRMKMPSRAGVEENFRTLKAGQLFGETAFLCSGRHGSTTVSRERSLILRIRGAELDAACEEDHTLGYMIYKLLGHTSAERVREATLELRNAIGSF